jgi:catechol 2,3-dioxygenase-like lactoylglutathione lyase family enzyme
MAPTGRCAPSHPRLASADDIGVGRNKPARSAFHAVGPHWKGILMRELHIGRLIDHVHLRARDLNATKRFYRAVLGALEKPIAADDEQHLACDELWIDALGGEQKSVTHVHLAFQAKDAEMVKRFHEAGVAAGGRDGGRPGERPYHPGYYAAFLQDPDGNNIEAVYHGRAERSADSVVIKALDL